MKKYKKWIVPALVILMLFSLAVGFIPAVGEKTADIINQPAEAVKNVARQILMLSIGLFLVYVGAVAALGTIIGGGLILVGLSLVVVAVWPWFKKGNED